jgi:leader peptidase (prepilin peptidase) / N-methyltransferase
VNVALVGGCAVAGLAAGLILDDLAARIPPAPPRAKVAEASSVAAANGLPVAAPPVSPPPAPPLRAPGPPGAVERVAVAVATALLLGLAAARIGAEPALAAYCVLFGGLVAVSVADLRVGLVPRVLLYPTFVLMAGALAAASAVDGRWTDFAHAAISGGGAFCVFFLLWWFYPRGIGFGDVRLAGVIAAGLGWISYGALYVGFASGFLFGVVVGLVLMLREGTGRKTRLAFGPPLALGAVIGVLWGTWVTHFWSVHP